MTFFFRDYSQYNGVVADPYPVRIARASIGRVKDTSYEAEKAQAAVEGDFFVAYHFLNHDTLDNIEAQAQFAFNVVGRHIPLMLDWESNRGYSATVAHAQRFINFYRALGGIVHTYYLPHWYWQGNLGSPSLLWFRDNGLSLISSNYTTYSDNGPGWNPYGGVAPIQWQFTSSPYDTNAFRGTVTEYQHIAFPEMDPIPPVIVPNPPVENGPSPMFSFLFNNAYNTAHVNPDGQLVLVYYVPNPNSVGGVWGEQIVGSGMVPGATISGTPAYGQYHLSTGMADNGNTVAHIVFDPASGWHFEVQGH